MSQVGDGMHAEVTPAPPPTLEGVAALADELKVQIMLMLGQMNDMQETINKCEEVIQQNENTIQQQKIVIDTLKAVFPSSSPSKLPPLAHPSVFNGSSDDAQSFLNSVQLTLRASGFLHVTKIGYLAKLSS